MTRHSQTINTTDKFHMPLQKWRIACQFLCWNYDGKNSQFVATNRQKFTEFAFLGGDDKIPSFFVTFGKWHDTDKLVIELTIFT